MNEKTLPTMGKSRFSPKELVLTAMFAAVLAVCSWISVPIGTIAITMQTFGIFCALNLLGGRKGLFSVIVFILLGAVGLPVFAGFKGGAAVLTGPTGGYLSGFILMGLIYMCGTWLFGEKLPVRLFLMTAGLAVCYTFGTMWFVFGYSKGGSSITFFNALKLCVIPFLPFDAVKLILAVTITERIKKQVKV